MELRSTKNASSSRSSSTQDTTAKDVTGQQVEQLSKAQNRDPAATPGYTKVENETTIACFGKYRKNFKWSKFGGAIGAESSAQAWLHTCRQEKSSTNSVAPEAKKAKKQPDEAQKKEKEAKAEEAAKQFRGKAGKPLPGETWLVYSQRRAKELKESGEISNPNQSVCMKIASAEWKQRQQ